VSTFNTFNIIEDFCVLNDIYTSGEDSVTPKDSQFRARVNSYKSTLTPSITSDISSFSGLALLDGCVMSFVGQSRRPIAHNFC
jgi:hypothetical protein